MKTQAVCRGFIMLNIGKTMSPLDATLAMNKEWGIHVDWHEFSKALDRLHSMGDVTLTGHDRSNMCIYHIDMHTK